jgi:peptidoglycan/xylan/chitin deacetylase (PgdA/CDA1 family)
MYRSDTAHGLMFHRFNKSNTKARAQGSLTEIDFENILTHVGINRIISPHEWMLRVESNTLQSEDLCITFDDGLLGQFEVALPVLKKYNLKAFWFIYSSVFNDEVNKNEIFNIFITSCHSSFKDFFQKFFSKLPFSHEIFKKSEYIVFYDYLKSKFSFYSDSDIKFRFIRNYVLSPDEFEDTIEEMISSSVTDVSELFNNIWLDNDNLLLLDDSDHYIGLHSYSHPYAISELSIKEQKSEYVKNYEHILGVTGKRTKCMSHPLGSYSHDTFSVLKDLGISCGFASNMTLNGNTYIENTSNFEIPREDSSNIKRMLKINC